MKKSVITLLIFLIMIISVSAVSAAENTPDLDVSEDTAISAPNTDTAVTAGNEVKNFTELNKAIADAYGVGELTLSSDYKRADGEEDLTIEINGNIVIDGNGSTIDGSHMHNDFINIKKGTASYIKVTLKNMIIMGAEDTHTFSPDKYGAINLRAPNELILDNVTFKDPYEDDTYAIVSEGKLTVKNCNFINHYGIYLTDTAQNVYISNNTVYGSNPYIDFHGSSNSKIIGAVVNLTANVDSQNWRMINFQANITDDNNNLLTRSGKDNTWNVQFNDVTKESYSNKDSIAGSSYAVTLGDNVVTVSFSSDWVAGPLVGTTNVEIYPPSYFLDSIIEFSYDPNPAQWNDTVTLTVTLKNYTDSLGILTPTGKVNLTITTISDEPITLDLVNGSASYIMENIGKGRWDVLIEYSGDNLFEANSTVVDFTVDSMKPKIELDVDNSTIGKQVITIILPSDAKGSVNATIGDVKYLNFAELNDGKVSFTAELPPSVNPYIVNVKFFASPENTNYTNTEANLEFYTDRFPSDIIIDVENVTYDDPVSFTITLVDEIEQASVIVTTKDGATLIYKNDAVSLNDGFASISLPVLAAGEYNITVTSIETPKYKVSTNSTLFNVSQFVPEVEISHGEPVLFENLTVTVTVNKPKNGRIELYDNGNLVGSEVLNENGVAEFNFTILTVGDHTIKAEFTPDDSVNYTSSESSKTFNVDKLIPKIIVDVGRVNIGQSANVEIIVEGVGDNVPAGSVYVQMGDFVMLEPLDVNGRASVVIDESYLKTLGSYAIHVTYLAQDTNYSTNQTDYTFEVSKWDVEFVVEVGDFTVNDEVILNVTAGNSSCPAELTGDVTVIIKDADGVIVNETSVKLQEGQKTPFTYELPAGNYTLEVSYPGDDKHNGNSTTSEVFSVKEVIENVSIVVENVDYPNKAIAVVNASVDGKYNVTIAGIDANYTVLVENGVGNVTLDLLAAGDYTINVVSCIDGYASKDNSTTFTVNNGTFNGVLTIEDVVYGDNATAFVTANIDGDYIIKDESDNQVAIVTVENGVGNASFAVNKNVGEWTYYVYAPQNDNCTPVTGPLNSTKFNVTNGTIIVNITVEDVDYPNQAVVIVNASVVGDYRIYVDGVYVGIVTVDSTGTGSVTLDKFAPETYEVNVTAVIPNYNVVNENAAFTVNKGTIIFNITAPEYVYGQDVVITLNTNVNGTNASEGLGYEIYRDGEKVANINNGTYNLGKLAAGKYEVKVVAKADDSAFAYYNVDDTTFNTTNVIVKTAEIQVSISVNPNSNLSYPGPVKLDITTDVTGNYTVTVGSFTKDIFVTAGTTETVDVYNLPVSINAYTATVTSKVGNYTETTNTTTFTVTYGTIDATINIENVPFGTAPIINITSTNANGTFTVTVNGKNYAVEVVNGNGIKAIEDVLYVNTYTAAWGANIDNYYQFMGTPIDFKVTPAPVDLFY